MKFQDQYMAQVIHFPNAWFDAAPIGDYKIKGDHQFSLPLTTRDLISSSNINRQTMPHSNGRPDDV